MKSLFKFNILAKMDAIVIAWQSSKRFVNTEQNHFDISVHKRTIVISNECLWLVERYANEIPPSCNKAPTHR